MAASASSVRAEPPPAGVIVDSTAAAFQPGDPVAADATLRVAEGETLVVLDRSGALHTFDTPGVHTLAAHEGEPATDAARDALAALFDTGARAEIGGTRDRDREACLRRAEADAALDPADCHVSADAPAPALDVALVNGGGAIPAGAPARFVITANFDAYAACQVTPATGDEARDVPLGPRVTAGAPVMRLNAGVTAYAPLRGSPPMALAEAPGAYVVRCEAFDVREAEALDRAFGQAEALTSAERARVRAGYLALRRARRAFATLTAEVSP